MQHGKLNYMDLNEDGTPKYDGINLQASIMRGDALEDQTGDRMFSNKTRVKQADGSYKFVYFDNDRNMIMNQDGARTKYDEIEEGKGTGGLADANVSNMNISYEVDAKGNPIDPSNNELTSFDHYTKTEDGPVHNKGVVYDPNKEYGNYVQNKNFEVDTQRKIDCETGANCPGGARGTYIPDENGGFCDCNEKIGGSCASMNMCDDPNNPGECIPCARYGKELTAFLKGGGTASEGAVLCDAYDKPIDPEKAWAADTNNNYKGPGMNNDSDKINRGLGPAFKYGGGLSKFQLKGGLEFDENGNVVKTKVLDLENESNKERKKRIKNYKHPHLQQYYDEFANSGISNEKYVRDIMSSMNVGSSDTLFTTKGYDANSIRSINNMDANQYIGSQMYDDGTGNWSGSISHDDKQDYYTTEQDEDGLSWDFLTNLYRNEEGTKTGVLKSRKKYGGALDAFVYGGALPKYQEAGPTTEGQTVCPPPEEGCPEGQTWDKQACSCMSAEINMADMSQDPYGVDAFNTNPMSNFDVNANAEDPMMVADESENSPSPEVPVMSKEQLEQQVYDENNMVNPNAARDDAGEFTCSDGTSKTREECEANGGTWNDPKNMGIDTDYGGGPLQKTWNKGREFFNTGVVGAVKDTVIGQSAEKYCSDPKWKTKDECEENGAKWTEQKGTGAVSLLFDNLMPMAHNIMGQNREHKADLYKRSVSAEDMFAATESGAGSGQRGFHDVNKGGIGDDLYGTGKIFGQTAQQGMEMPPQKQKDFSVASAYMNQEDGIKFDLELLKQQKNYLGKMYMGGQLPMFQKGKEKPWYSKVADYTQTALSGVGMTPGPIGFVADAINTGVSGTRAGYNTAIGDTESAKIHGENLALNATSMIPGPAGWVAGGTALAKDAANYAGVTDSNKSVTTQVADAVTDKKEPLITENMNGTKKIGNTAKYGKETADIDMDLYYELLRSGAEIKIIR